ncbi:NRT1/ PTR FAMILY 5.8 [Thalictrum thalictroides]|uniref:NRT1/ PTR FAMILY 5.8 n=1 Tax=Thalictrum thalictroides TaxID=46969 RepID=A0A7J6VCY8_THATH|nr:NRT1/ PTR FAMILY 5.8 [Thalictrum thalictroides]
MMYIYLVVAGVERFAFKGVASNLVTYLTDVVKLSNSSAAKTVNSWCGVTFMLPLLGAFLADSFFDRHSTILASSVLYVFGLVALTSTAFVWESIPSSNASCSFLLLSLFMISLGQGGYNPCLQAFGADQLDNDEELPLSKEDQISDAKKSSFFKWWYFGICTGSLLGVSCMAYLQDIFGWGLGFAIPTIAMATSVLPFSCGNQCYTHKDPKGGGKKRMQDLIKAIKATASKMINGKIKLSAKEVVELELEEKPLCNQKFEYTKSMTEDSNHIVASDAKVILRLLPIWAMMLMFAIIFQQPATFFTKQGMTMKRNIGKEFLIPPASLQSAINISIILLMPLYDKIVIPILRIITRDDKGINVMQRMGIGMFLSIIAMVIAAFVETKRLEISRRSDLSLSIFWLLPQYIILGISDVFTVVGMQEFFYTEVPNNMKTMGMALHLSVFGVGSFLSALLISVIEFLTSDKDGKHSWFSDDMNEAHLDLYYWFLGLLSAISLMLFVHLCKNYISRNSGLNQNCK